MKGRQRAALSGVAVAGLLAAMGAGPAQAASSNAQQFKSPEVDAAVQVTKDPGTARGHAIPALAIDPRDNQTLVEADTDAYSSRCTVHVSRNGGLTWSDATQPQTPPDWPGCGFAVTGVAADLAFAADGTLYYAFSAYQPTTYQQRIYLARSTDIGLTWDVTALPRIGPDPAQRLMGADAMPSLVVDRTDPKRIYVSWWSGNGTWNMPSSITGADGSVWCRLVDNKIVARPWVAVSNDGGATFGNPVDMAPGIPLCTTEPYLAQAKDGTILALFGEATRTLDAGKAPPSHVYFSESHDQGKTWAVKPIHEQSGPADGKASTSTSDWLSGVSIATDLTNGNIYATWEELGAGVPRILFERSVDGGKTWGEPVKVNDGDPKRDWDFSEQFPTMTVAPNGRIDIAWYDWRNDPGYKDGDTRDQFQDVYLATSNDGGKTFGKNAKVNDRAIDRRFGPRRQGSIDGPLGIVSTDATTYIAWDDTRNGSDAAPSEDIYFTRARYTPASETFGGTAKKDTGISPWLAGLLGAAVALAIGGIGLVVGTSMTKGKVDRDLAAQPQPGVPGRGPSVPA